MSWLTLVRHGQASFHSEDYDQLSPLGEKQSQLLGDGWVAQNARIDKVITGPRRRQRQTAEIVGSRFHSADLSWPTPILLEDFDEYDLAGLTRRVLPPLVERDRDFAQLVANYRKDADDIEKARRFQRMFERLLTHWTTSEEPPVGVESWSDFKTRVGRALANLQSEVGQGQRVVAFTSGGFIGAAVRHALSAPDPAALQLSFRIRNASLTDFVFTPDRLTLDGFNRLEHLNDPSHWTFR